MYLIIVKMRERITKYNIMYIVYSVYSKKRRVYKNGMINNKGYVLLRYDVQYVLVFVLLSHQCANRRCRSSAIRHYDV